MSGLNDLPPVPADHPARRRVVELEERARTASSPQSLARDQELWLERRGHEREIDELRRTLSRSNESFAGGDAAKDVLKSLHEELKSRRVPQAESPSPRS